MSVVVDASVLVAALVDTGSQGAWSEDVLEDSPLNAPKLVRVEAANILRRLERAGDIATAEANAAFEDLIDLDLELFAFDPFAERVWELRHNVTAYDAWYVALAESLKVPLATLDVSLSKATGPKCRFLIPAGK